MSDKPKFPRAVALEVAAQMCRALKPWCDKLIVAGSLRRRKAEVGDVEICFLGQIGMLPDAADLFGKLVATNLARREIDGLVSDCTLKPRPKADGTFTWGNYNRLAIHTASGVPVDFFTCEPAGWWSLLVCRTGSAASNERICNAAIARGLRWNPYLGFEDRQSGGLVHVARSEADVFKRVGLPYAEPWERE
jgi:DNA polymerase/3'-5' exonuclease PolX